MPLNVLDATPDGNLSQENADVQGDSLANWAIAQINGARPRIAAWRKQARECDRFKAGRHFSKAAMEQLQNEERPHASFNAAQKWIRFVSGIEQAMMTEAVFVPRDPQNDRATQGGALVTKGIQYVLDNCCGDDERSRAFEDMLTRGMGWTDVSFDRSVEVQGMINLTRVDGHEMLWDDSARKMNLEDARWMARERQLHKRDALKRWPDHKAVILANLGQPNADDRPGESTLINEKVAIPLDAAEWPAVKPQHVRVIEFQWYDEIVGVYFADPLTGKEDWMEEVEFEEYHRQYKKAVPALRRAKPDLPDTIESDRMLMKSYRRMVIIGQTVVVGPHELPGKRFTFNVLCGQWDDEEQLWYGYMRLLLDPQRYLTKFANQVMEIITRSAKGGLVAEIGTFINPVDVERNWSKVGSVAWTDENKFDKWKEKSQPTLPPASIEMFQACMGMLKEVTGVNPEISMGMGASDQPALTMRQRQASTLLLLSPEFASLRRYRISESRTIFDFMPFIADDRWVRVGGPYESEAIQLLHDPFLLEYDVVFDEGTRDPNVRREIWATLERMAPTLIRTNNWLPEFYSYAPLPAKDRFLLKQRTIQMADQKRKMAAMGIQDGGRGKPTSLQELQARTAQLQADASFKQAKALSLTEGIKSARAKALADTILKAQQQEAEERMHQQEMAQQALQAAQQPPQGPPQQ